MAEWMTIKQGHTIDYVLVSPYLRAQQTLEAVKVDLALPSKIETDDGLIPGESSHIAHYLRALGIQDIKYSCYFSLTFGWLCCC